MQHFYASEACTNIPQHTVCRGVFYLDMKWAIDALHQYGLLGIFIVLALEYACFPMPSEVLLPVAGFAVATAGFPLALGVAVSVLAGLVGSAFCYALGAWGGRPLLDKLLRRMPKARAGLARTEAWQARSGGLSVMVARVIPLFRTWISFVSGFTRQPFFSFMLYSSIGIILWNTLLMGSGYYLFTSGVTAEVSDKLWVLPLISFGIVMVVMLIRKLIAKRRQPMASQAQ